MAFTEKGGGGFTSYLGAVRRAVDSISPTYTSTPEERNRCVETLLRTTIESEYVTKVALSALPCADNGSRHPPESRGYHLTPSNLSSILCRGKEALNEREETYSKTGTIPRCCFSLSSAAREHCLVRLREISDTGPRPRPATTVQQVKRLASSRPRSPLSSTLLPRLMINIVLGPSQPWCLRAVPLDADR